MLASDVNPFFKQIILQYHGSILKSRNFTEIKKIINNTVNPT